MRVIRGSLLLVQTNKENKQNETEWAASYLMPLLNSFLHDLTSWQPGGLVEIQTVQELLPNHLQCLLETLLRIK